MVAPERRAVERLTVGSKSVVRFNEAGAWSPRKVRIVSSAATFRSCSMLQ